MYVNVHRPYSNEMGYEDPHVLALLSVRLFSILIFFFFSYFILYVPHLSFSIRCLPGYPYKCPKLQILPDKGLSKDDADRLLSLLLDQVLETVNIESIFSSFYVYNLYYG